MASAITLALTPLKLPLAGASGIEVSVDGNVCADVPFGASTSIEVAPGEHRVSATLKGLIPRKSKVVTVLLPDSHRVAIVAKYVRWSGGIKLACGVVKPI